MKFLSRSSLVIASGVALASLVGFAGNAQAQNATNISVTINPVCKFLGVPADNSQTVDSLSSVTNGGGNIVVECNNPTGFAVTAVSTKGGALKHSNTAITQTIPYTVTTEAGTSGATIVSTPTIIQASPTATTLATTNAFSDPCAATTGCIIPLSYAINNTASVPAGTYSDTITYTITANN